MPISLSGSLNLSGSLTTTGTITATTLVVQTITSSISSITGSTNFGSLSTNTHVFTGSMFVTGAFYVTTGNVGIGTTSPSGSFHVQATNSGIVFDTATAYTPRIKAAGALSDLQIESVGNGGNLILSAPGTTSIMTMSTNAAERMRITSAGRVAIGRTSPGTALSVAGQSEQWQLALSTDTGSGAIIGSPSANVLAFGDWSGAERMRITADGYTKMSSTGTYALSTGYYHEFYGGAANGYTLIVTSNVATPLAQYVIDIRFSAATPNNTTARFLHCSDATATRAIIRSNGGLANYQSNNADLSDIRTKKDIISLESYWDKFKALEIVKYKYKDQTHDDFNIGVIAQQVESVAPEFVDVDGWSKNDIESESPLKSIYTKDLYHATIKVLQEAMTKIETLEARVQYLENK